MTPELEALARRLVACKGWRWVPGMLSSGRRVVQAEAGAVCGTGVRMLWSGGWVSDPVYIDDLPDLTDPATAGCLLAMLGRPTTLPAPWVSDWHAGVPLGEAVARALLVVWEAAP